MTDIQLCNMAMAYLKVQLIESLDEESEQAHLCKEYLQTCIDETLTYSHQFSFTKVYIKIEEPLDDVYRDYEYLYQPPEDFLQPVEMINMQNEEWEMVQKGIACHENPLEMVYLKTVKSVPDLPSHVSRAVSYRLAMTVGPLLAAAQDEAVEKSATMFTQFIREAANQDGRKNRLSKRGAYTLLED